MTLLDKIGWINNSKYVVYICVVVYYTAKFELFTSTSSGDEICWRCSIGDTRATSDDNFAIFPRPRLYMWSVSSDPAWITNFVKKKAKKSPKVSPFFSLSIQLGLYICSPSLILWYPKGISNQKSRNDDEVPVIAQSKCSTTWNVVRSFENPISARDKSRPPAPKWPKLRNWFPGGKTWLNKEHRRGSSRCQTENI